ncbi:unnamed protein product [Victoria cruziana]
MIQFFFHKTATIRPLLRASPLLHARSLHLHHKPEWRAKCGSVQTHPVLGVLEKCTAMSHLKQLHAQMIATNLIQNVSAASQMVGFLAAGQVPGGLDHCLAILNKMESSDSSVWNSAIRSLSDNDDPKQAVFVYKQMLVMDVLPDKYTFPFVLKACGRFRVVGRIGEELHGHVLKLGFDMDVYVQNALIHVRCANGQVQEASKLFLQMPQRDLVSWNSMINGYVQCGLSEEALGLFREMVALDVQPDVVTMISVASASARLGRLDIGRWVHDLIIQKGIVFTAKLRNALMDMYVKCDCLEAARKIFDEMPSRTIVSWTTMVVGYSKQGKLSEARRLFVEMPEMDIVPWNAMLAGYVQCRRPKEALSLFHEMQSTPIQPNEVTMSILLSSCAQLGALDIGEWVHRYIDKHNIRYTVELGTSLVDMYAKCGNIKRSLRAFLDIPEKNSLTWTAMITGLASHGHGRDAISLFSEMINRGYLPDEITFLGVLSACCHNGLVDEGRHFFSQMTSRFNVMPKSKHYACMVDLLGRAGLLGEALELIEQNANMADAVVWGAFFFSCRAHGNVEMGELAASRLLELDPGDPGIYVLLANLYTEANMLDKATKARKMMKDRGIEKAPGCSSIEVNGVVNEFIVRDKSHPKTGEIYACLSEMHKHSQMGGSFC